MESQGNIQTRSHNMNVLINRPEFIILSACQGKDIQSDESNTSKLEKSLIERGYLFKRVLGCYGSKKEVSFYVQSNDIRDLLGLSQVYNQECILFVDADRQASLIRSNGFLRQVDKIGTFQQVKQFEALTSQSYTYDHENNGYYICK
jgi:hypothetical protein